MVHSLAEDTQPARPEQGDLVLDLADEAATQALANVLAPILAQCQPAAGVLKVYLRGDLGCGKTTLVRALLRKQGFAGRVRSPSYTLIEPYTVSRLNWYHFDFYRFSDPDEFLDAGLEEYFYGAAICLVEWPEKAAPHLPAADLVLAFETVAAKQRRLHMRGTSVAGTQCLTQLKNSLPLRPPCA